MKMPACMCSKPSTCTRRNYAQALKSVYNLYPKDFHHSPFATENTETFEKKIRFSVAIPDLKECIHEHPVCFLPNALYPRPGPNARCASRSGLKEIDSL